MNSLNKHFYKNGKPKRYMQVYLYLIEESEKLNGNWPPIALIARRFGISEQGIYNHIARLQKYGFVSKLGDKWFFTGANLSLPEVYYSLIEKMKG